MFTPEEQLILAIFFLYGYSCSFVVLPSEIYFEVTQYRRKILFPQIHFSFLKKDLLFVNPFFFYKAIIVLSQSSPNIEKEFRKQHFRIYFLKRCLPFVAMIWILTLIAIPLSLMFSNIALLISFGGLLYGIILLFIFFLWFSKRALKLTAKQLLRISFEFLLCPPFAANGIIYLSFELK